MPKPTKTRAKERLQRALDAIPVLKQLAGGSPEFEKWQRDTKVAITNTFIESPDKSQDFEDVRYGPGFFVVGEHNELRVQAAYTRGLDSAAAVLKSMIEEIEEYWEDDAQESDSSRSPGTSERVSTNQVFIIHGRDYGTRETVARFLENLGLEAVILQEQPDQGRTIIEKFEQYAQCDFALALFTPDDVGGSEEDGLQPRARQNVIFEFGYFIGKFGRDRVRALVKERPEIPSDYSGVIYIRLDESGGWKMELMKELKSAGFEIDANLALG